MLELLNEEKSKKVNMFLDIFLNKDFYYQKRYFYSVENEKLWDILSLITISNSLNINIENLKLFIKFVENLQDFFGDNIKIQLFKYKGNFKNKKTNGIYYKNIDNNLLILNEKYILFKDLKISNKDIEYSEKNVEILNKKIFKLPIVRKIILDIIETWRIKKDNFYYLLNKSTKFKSNN